MYPRGAIITYYIKAKRGGTEINKYSRKNIVLSLLLFFQKFLLNSEMRRKKVRYFLAQVLFFNFWSHD